MTIYKLKDLLDSQYNRSDVKRHQRSVLFLIQNTVTGNQSLYEIDRIAIFDFKYRQAEISKPCRSISHMSIDNQITNFTELLTCLGNANTSEFVLDQIPKDFLYLNDLIFQ